jgi:hypothetical protein
MAIVLTSILAIAMVVYSAFTMAPGIKFYEVVVILDIMIVNRKYNLNFKIIMDFIIIFFYC